MATITSTPIDGAGTVSLTATTLDGSSDTFTRNDSSDKLQLLYLHNPTGGPISPTIVGDAASATFPISGGATVDLSAGYAVGAIAAGAEVVISVDTIRHYLDGTITINSGSGLEALVLEKTVSAGSWKAGQ